MVIRFALLDTMAFVITEIPVNGSGGTSLEQPCVRPHWGFVSEGEVEFESGSRSETVRAGSAFHVPAGDPPHRFLARGAARIAGFEPLETALDATDSALAARGFEVLSPDRLGAALMPVTIMPLPGPKQIDVRAWPMSPFVMAHARFGPGSGYTTDWCDTPHWGLVTSGGIAIEWEDDIEILAAGDIYRCPAGPPGHRLEAADAASVIDLTPIEGYRGTRVAPWRLWPSPERALSDQEPIAVAGLG